MTDTEQLPLITESSDLALQLQEQRRTVDFDSYDIHVLQLLSQVERGQIFMAPTYQRKFRWDLSRCSALVESLMLGIPVPTVFMASNPNGTWEVVDGVQRLSAIIKFAGDKKVRDKLGLNGPLVLSDLQKLTHFNGKTFESLPQNIRTHFETRPVKVVTLSDKSNAVVRYDLFERLNTGGVSLTPQEIRDCVYRGPFAKLLDDLSKDPNYKKVLVLTAQQQKDGTIEECVLRFFAFLHGYKKFEHSVQGFLNDYMQTATAKENHDADTKTFRGTMAALAKVFPDGLRRVGPREGGTTSLILFEGVSVGAALALRTRGRLHTAGLKGWLGSAELRKYTTGATNDRAAVKGRIEFCRDRFLGKPYVPTATA